MADFQKRSPGVALNTTGKKIIPAFGGSYADFMEPFWFVEKIEYSFGPEPGSFTISCPTTGWGGVAPLLAGLPKSGGPISNAKIWKPCSAKLDGVTLMNGCNVIIDENFEKDGATIEVLDPRYEMEGCVIVGSWWIQDVRNGGVKWRQSVPAWFNKNGLPNRTKGYDGFTYAFCESNYGLKDGEVVPDPSQNIEGKSTFWTPDSITVMIQECTNKALVSSFLEGACPEYCFLPDDVIFPKGVANALTSFVTDSSSTNISMGKAAELVIDATPLNHALNHVFEMAGPYALTMTYGKDGKSTIAVARTRATGNGVSLTRAIGNANDVFNKDGVVTGGGIRRDASRLYSQAIVAGNTQYVETRLSSSDDESIEAQVASGIELITAWDPKIKDEIIKRFNKAIDDHVPLTLQQLLQEYDLAYAAWRLNPDKAIAAGTGEYKRPQCRTQNRTILPHLLTRQIVKDNAKPSDPGYQLKTGYLPIAVEYSKFVFTVDPYDPGNAPPQADGYDESAPTPQAGDINYPPDTPGTSEPSSPPDESYPEDVPATSGSGSGKGNGAGPASERDWDE